MTGLRTLHAIAAALVGLAAITAVLGLRILAIAAAVAVHFLLIISLEAQRHALAEWRKRP